MRWCNEHADTSFMQNAFKRSKREKEGEKKTDNTLYTSSGHRDGFDSRSFLWSNISNTYNLNG